jgi:hypothetical protein
MALFQCLRQGDIAQRIDAARSVVIYAAPGVTPAVADALLGASARMPCGVTAILDVSAHSARMGYGQFEQVKRLKDGGVDVRQEAGLRQALLVADNSGWAFTLPAQLLETDAPEGTAAPNAIELTLAQVAALRGELPRPGGAATEAEPDGGQEERPVRVLGAERIAPAIVAQVEQELTVAPPQPFDLARQIQVYTSFVRFVELEMKGWKLEGRRIALPKDLPVLATKDKEMIDRVRASLKVLEELDGSQFKALRDEVERIRKKYCHRIGDYGSLALVSEQSELEGRVDHIREKLKAATKSISSEITAELGRVKNALVGELARAVRKQPPARFKLLYEQSLKGAKSYVTEVLEELFPTTDKVVEGISLRLTFKGVTYGALEDEKFKDAALTAFPRDALPNGLHEEFDAAKKRLGPGFAHAGL